MMRVRLVSSALVLAWGLAFLPVRVAAGALPVAFVDLAEVAPSGHQLLRVHGSRGNGAFGVPVAAGGDVDGDGLADLAFAAMLADVGVGRDAAGEVYLVFGERTLGDRRDTGVADPGILHLIGAGRRENAGSELWIDDVTGDGLADLLIARQNHSPSGARIGAGSLMIVAGSPVLRELAASFTAIDLAAPPGEMTVLDVIGANPFDRLGIWVRSGDVDGDGIADVLVGADQQNLPGGDDNGAVYVLRGGPHLAQSAKVDLATFGATRIAGHVALILPPAASRNFHLGATVAAGDLDANGRAEVFVAAALNRAGAALPPDGGSGTAEPRGGSARGTLYIVWDDNFPEAGAPWPDGFTIRLATPPGSVSVIDGGSRNESFGEEVVGGFDYDDNGEADLFVGDIVGDLSPSGNRSASGSGHVFWSAAALKGRSFNLDNQPPAIERSDFLGAAGGEIAADTALLGDFDGDGIADLAFSAPHADVPGRASAGRVYVFHGSDERFPAVVDLASLGGGFPGRVTVLDGARGGAGADSGDTLAYSALGADVDGDGTSDYVLNEMEGNGLQPGTVDVGNLLVVSGAFVAGYPRVAACPERDAVVCRRSLSSRSTVGVRDDGAASASGLRWILRDGEATKAEAFGRLDLEGDGLRLCFYADADPAAFAEVLLAGGEACGRRPCWAKRGRGGWRYRDADGGRAGIRRLLVRAGGDGLSRVELAGLGAVPLLEELPLAPDLLVRLVPRRTDDGCWESRFDRYRTNDASRLRAREEP